MSALHFCFFNYTLGNRDIQKMLLDWSTFASVKSRLLSKISDRGGAEERKPVSKETASRVRLNFRSTSEPFQLEIKLNLCKQQWRHLWHKRIERRKRTHLQVPGGGGGGAIMVHPCIVEGCKNKARDGIFRFPRDPVLRMQVKHHCFWYILSSLFLCR